MNKFAQFFFNYIHWSRNKNFVECISSSLDDRIIPPQRGTKFLKSECPLLSGMNFSLPEKLKIQVGIHITGVERIGFLVCVSSRATEPYCFLSMPGYINHWQKWSITEGRSNIFLIGIQNQAEMDVKHITRNKFSFPSGPKQMGKKSACWVFIWETSYKSILLPLRFHCRFNTAQEIWESTHSF